TGWGSISILPTSATVLASMPVLFKKSDLLSVSIPWIARSAVSKQEVVSALSGFNGTQVTYSKRSYIEFGTPLTQAQYNALSAAKPAYVTSLQPNYAGVQDGFANTSSVLADMTAYSPGFPTSDLTVEFSGNSSGVSGALSAYLASKNITAQPTMSGAYVLSVPDSLVSQDTNETYTVAGGINNITIESNLPLALGSNVTMALSVSEVAGVIVDISGATPISARTPGNATQTMPPLNSTGAAPGTGVPPADNSSANATTVGNTGANSSAGNSGAFVPVDNSSSSAPANNSSSSAPVVNSSAPVFTGNA
ncbi:MAG TPA: hypothetical protein PLO51_05935, partial [Candidatus Micrarchaeota archaeon]|nr:hypothetical protein [Candidatus Micrarchaeota archaeon]